MTTPKSAAAGKPARKRTAKKSTPAPAKKSAARRRDVDEQLARAERAKVTGLLTDDGGRVLTDDGGRPMLRTAAVEQ